jgi:hypothetical protein
MLGNILVAGHEHVTSIYASVIRSLRRNSLSRFVCVRRHSREVMHAFS